MGIQNGPKLIQWKKLWQLLSGIHYATPHSTVRDELASIKTDLLNGIKTEAVTTNVDKKLSDCPESLQAFINKLRQFLDLSKQETWNIFCCYLQNEYNDSIDLLLNYLKTETNTLKLLNSIWEYQSLERMTLLKVLKNILEFHKSREHPFADEYKTILNEIGIDNLRKSYVEQLTQHIKEQTPLKYTHADVFNVQNKLVASTERKLRETNEILQILLLLIDSGNLKSVEFKELLDLFRSHSFGRQQPYLDLTNNALHKDLVQKITFSEIALFIKCIDKNTTEEPNIDWINEVSLKLDKDIILLHQQAEHGSLLLSWMLMNFHVVELSDENEKFRKFRQYGVKAAQLGVFNYLHAMVTHSMYRDQSLAAEIVCRTIYHQIGFMCDVFDCERIVSQYKNIYELLSELLKWPNIAKDFFSNQDGGARALWMSAVENFPLVFEPLAIIANAVSTTGATFARQIREKVENLPNHTELYNANRINLRPSDTIEDEFMLTHDYNPFGMKIDFTIPARSIVSVVDKPTGTQVHFKTKMNFFNALHNEINELLFELIKRPEIDDQHKNRIGVGLKFLASVVRRIKNPFDIPSEMVHPTEMVFDILLKFKDVPNPPISLLAQCVEVCTALVPMLQVEVYKRIVNLDILPFCSTNNFTYRECAKGSNFDTGTVGFYLVSFEKPTGNFEFLTAYLGLLKAFANTELEQTISMEVAGLIFLLREVFPFIHSWRFENELDRLRLTSQILQYFCDILQIPDENTKRIILRDTCVYSLLNLDGGMTLLRIVAVGNSHIEAIMQNETNWMTAENTSFNLLVRLAMTILMHILRLRNRVANEKSESYLSPLEHIIYTQPRHVIPVVTSYMRNIFNRRLPILSCLLLRRFAIEFQMSLLACLDMEQSQIRSTFLERLENELESDQLKIAVLEFVEACIDKQPGLTEAFFKINYESATPQTTDQKAKSADQKRSKELGEGILTFMKLYLKIVGDDPNAIADNTNEEGRLLGQIMSLFHSLWKNNMQTLVEKLLNEKDFWRFVLNPLFGRIQPNLRVYSQLFNMIGLELYRMVDPKDVDEGFKKTLDRFLDHEVFFPWVDNVLALPTVVETITDETPDWLCRLQSFKDLFVIILRRANRHGISVPSKSLDYFADRCLEKLTEHVHFTDEYRPFIVLAELYTTLLLCYSHKYKATVGDDRKLLKQIAELVNELAVCYSEMHIRAKESILAIAFKAVELFGDVLNASDNIDFIESIVKIVCEELNATENHYKKKLPSEVTKERRNLSFILSFNALKAITSQCGDISGVEELLQSNRVFNRILSCLYVTLPIYEARKVSYEMLDALNVFSNDGFAPQLLHCEFGEYLWLKLLPPKQLLQSSDVARTSSNGNESTAVGSWQSQDWWPIYRRGVQLVNSMLHQNGNLFAKDVITFVGVHEEFLMDSILLVKHTLNQTAIQLTRSALDLVNELIRFEKQWRLEHQQSMINLMRCVQVILDYSVSLLQRPKILRRLLHNFSSNGQAKSIDTGANSSSNDIDSIEDETDAMNNLIRFIVICTKCLLGFSPKVIDQLTACDFVPSQWQPLIEIQFNAPKLNVNTPFPQLTFGSVLNAAVIFTRALNLQQYSFSGIPLNDIPAGNEAERSVRFDQTTLDSSRLHENSNRRRRSNVSAQLSTSTTIASNEHLVNLDAELCLTALEFILTLLASQSLLALADAALSQREKQLIKRELCTELSIFHEFVRKRILCETARDEPLRRKKHGLVQMEPVNLTYNSRPDKRRSIGHKSATDSMRIKVTRQLHLSSQPSEYSPITSFSGISGRSALPSSTPAAGQLKSCLKTTATTPRQTQKRFGEPIESPIDIVDDSVRMDEPDDDSQLYFEPEDPTFCETSFVRIVEEDYLQFLSNVFTFICHTEKCN